MRKQTSICLLLIAFAALALPGCMPKMTIEDMKAEMPKRPVELDRLAMFEGTWESTGEAEFAGVDQILKAKGTSTYTWANDGWHLMEQSDFEMDEFGKATGTGLWGYDPKSKKYRIWWFDSHGSVATGKGTYDEANRTWKLTGKDRTSWGTLSFYGTMTFVDDNTVDWSYDERAFFGLFKVMRFEGTMRRQ